MNYIDRYKLGLSSEEDIHDFIEAWHTSSGEQHLHEYLGMTWSEYQTCISIDDLEYIYKK